MFKHPLIKYTGKKVGLIDYEHIIHTEIVWYSSKPILKKLLSFLNRKDFLLIYYDWGEFQFNEEAYNKEVIYGILASYEARKYFNKTAPDGNNTLFIKFKDAETMILAKVLLNV